MKHAGLLLIPLFMTPTVSAALPSSPVLGTAEARCRPSEPGPAAMVTVTHFKDYRGGVRIEVYPPTQADFLGDDNALVAAGKTFRRVDLYPLPSHDVTMCVRLPGPGDYTMMVLHDRNSTRKFSLFSDGIGLPGTPHLGLSKPKAAQAMFHAGPGLTPLTVRLNYYL